MKSYSLPDGTDRSRDLDYSGLRAVPLDSFGKPTDSWMREWTQEQRTEKFFEFCRAYDEREDSLLRDNYQQFSHRLHWNECPFVEELSAISDPVDALEACLLFSFTNEHWITYRAWSKEGMKGVRDRFAEGHRPCRSDLFQVYYPKGTRVEEWLVVGPREAARAIGPSLKGINRPVSMMKFTYALNAHFVGSQGFRDAKYPCKNTARHIAMAHPEWVDPESFLHGGTGFFDGLHQVFGGKKLGGRCKYSINEDGLYIPENEAGRGLVASMDYLLRHPGNPIVRHKYLNIEDKLCMMMKRMSIHMGIKKTTKQIPYEWVYPETWSLKTGKYDRL